MKRFALVRSCMAAPAPLARPGPSLRPARCCRLRQGIGIAALPILEGACLTLDQLCAAGALERCRGTPAEVCAARWREHRLALIEVYARTFEPGLAQARMARVREGGIEHIRFGWAGATERGKPHYYRVQGPLFLIEYDASQNDGNHVHTVWRDFSGDFGRDLLREHYEHLLRTFDPHRLVACTRGDFLAPPDFPGNFAGVIMNPPFSRRQDALHIRAAFRQLRPGGRLVSVASGGLAFRRDALHREVREQIEAWGGSIEPLPAESFKASGTSVNTVLVVATRPGGGV